MGLKSGLAPVTERSAVLPPHSSFPHQPEVVFCVLIQVLGFDPTAGSQCSMGQCEIAFVAPFGIAQFV
jgi:fumarate hydratase class II